MPACNFKIRLVVTTKTLMSKFSLVTSSYHSSKGQNLGMTTKKMISSLLHDNNDNNNDDDDQTPLIPRNDDRYCMRAMLAAGVNTSERGES